MRGKVKEKFKIAAKNGVVLCLAAAMSVGMSGCGKNGADAAGTEIIADAISAGTASDAGGESSDSVTAGSAEIENASMEQNASSELFREDENGEWWFDTSQFDASKFDGKLYPDGLEVTLPLTVSDLHEAGIYCEGSINMTIEDAEQKYETLALSDGDEQSELFIYKAEDGVLKSVESVSQITMYNLNDDEEDDNRLLKNSKVGTLNLHGGSANEAEYMLEALNLEGRENDAGQHYLDVESLIEAYGPPCFYKNGSLSSFLYYYYGDYSMKYMEQGGRIIMASYIGTEYLEAEEMHIVPSWSDTELEYMEAYSKLK